jgi:hypothetical protein
MRFPFPVRGTIAPEMKINIERRCDNTSEVVDMKTNLFGSNEEKNDCYSRIASENLRHDHHGKIEEPKNFLLKHDCTNNVDM